LHFFFCEHRQCFLNRTDRTIASALPEEKNIFDVVLNDGARLIRLTIESCTVAFRFGHSIGDFVPKNRSQTVQVEGASANLNVRVKGHDVVPPTLFARNANVSNHAANSPTGNKYAPAFNPYLVQFIEKMLITLDVSHLSGDGVVILERPIRRGSHDEMN